MKINLNDETYKCEFCKEGVTHMLEECKKIYSVLQGSNFNREMFAEVCNNLVYISRKFEEYAILFDAQKRRLEQETIINQVYASPDSFK